MKKGKKIFFAPSKEGVDFFPNTYYIDLHEEQRMAAMTLGERIRELRIASNLSLRDLQKKVDTDFTYLSKIENDNTDHPPSEGLLRKLAVVLKGNENELLELAGRMPKDAKEALKTMGTTGAAMDFFRSDVTRQLTKEEWKDLQKRAKDLLEKRKRG